MATARITEIRLSPGASREHEADELCLWMDYFVAAAVEEFGYVPAELPEGAHDFTDLWKYHGECRNGGHAQYRGNTDCDVSQWRKALRALKRIGLPEYEGLIEEFIQFSVEQEDRIEALYGEDEYAADRLFYGFDERFNTLENANGGLKSAMHAWLIGQDWFVVDRALPAFNMERLHQSIPPHPLREERRAALHRKNAAENHGANMAFLRRLLDQRDGKSNA